MLHVVAGNDEEKACRPENIPSITLNFVSGSLNRERSYHAHRRFGSEHEAEPLSLLVRDSVSSVLT